MQLNEARVKIETNPEDEGALAAIVTPVTAKAHGLTVTKATVGSLGAYLKNCRDAKAVVNTFFDPPIKKIREALDMMLARKKSVLRPIIEAEDIIKGKFTRFQIAEQARTEKAAKLEREKQQKIAEDAKLAQAALAEQAGEDDLAQQIIEASTPVAAPITPKAQAVKGVTLKTVRHWEPIDTKAAKVALIESLLAKIKADVVPVDALVPSKTFLNSQCKALKENFAKAYPGTRYWETQEAAGTIYK